LAPKGWYEVTGKFSGRKAQIVAMPEPASLPAGGQPEGFWYTAKRRLLGPPLVNEQLSEERLSKKLALGVLSPDGISSSAYGTEEILIELLPLFGIAAFAVLLPMTGVILFVLTLVVLSYREVVTVYTRAGGSYVVARDNFGPRIAQVAAVALLIDYVVTVGVQIAAGTAAVASAAPVIGPYDREVSIGIILLMCYGNLRGIREAGKVFALPTYLFSGVVIVMIAVGLVRAGLGNLPMQNVYALHGTYQIGSGTAGVATAIVAFRLLRAFANGGSSLTGIEAVSNAVSAFKPPEGINARKVLVAEGIILGILVAGISVLARLTHAVPYISGYPTVISQEANMVFGQTGHFMFYVVQAATALILYTGGNTSFNGFPFLTNFVAEDSFLPRWMTKRGHRLVFSNGILVLTVASVTLIAIFGSNVNNLVPFYAIGVFTAFSMAGFGMAKYHHTHKEPGWRRKLVINFSAGVLTGIVVVIFAVVKFTEGAWLVVILFPVLVFALIRLNREYRSEAEVLEHIEGQVTAGHMPRQPNFTRRVVVVFVDDWDLATIAAIRYAKSLRPTSVRAVHFAIDSAVATRLQAAWQAERGVQLEIVDCPDRRLTWAAEELVRTEASVPGTQVTAILPRRSYSPLISRLLHDRTADKIAGVVSRVPNAAATIIPFDVRNRVRVLQERQAARAAKAAAAQPVPADTAGEAQPGAAAAQKPLPVPPTGPDQRELAADTAAATPDTVPLPGAGSYMRPVPPPGVNPIGSLHQPGKAVVEGRVRVVEIRPVERNSVLVAEISDATGDLTAMFYGRQDIPGMMCGARVRFRGPVGIKNGKPVMVNPAYELIVAGQPTGKKSKSAADEV
jgi:amino acid transporter